MEAKEGVVASQNSPPSSMEHRNDMINASGHVQEVDRR